MRLFDQLNEFFAPRYLPQQTISADDIFFLDADWDTIESEQGMFNETAIETLAQKAKDTTAHGKTVMGTLFNGHYPEWFTQEGGFNNSRAPQLYFPYMQTIIKRLGEYVQLWEPFQTIPVVPGTNDNFLFDRLLTHSFFGNVALCQVLVYREIHDQLGYYAPQSRGATGGQTDGTPADGAHPSGNTPSKLTNVCVLCNGTPDMARWVRRITSAQKAQYHLAKNPPFEDSNILSISSSN